MSRGPDPLACPEAEYRERMIIWCRKTGGPCGHVHFYSCKGWWVLTPQAEKCPIRRDDNGESDTAAADRRHPV